MNCKQLQTSRLVKNKRKTKKENVGDLPTRLATNKYQ